MKKLYLFLLIATSCLCSLHARQDGQVCTGTVCDSAMTPLPNVRIYCRDTVPVYSDRNGTFRIRANIGDKLHFRKPGYGWHTEQIAQPDMQKVILTPSIPGSVASELGPDNMDFLYDGKPVPFEEWDDASCTPREEVLSVRMLKIKYNDDNPANSIVIRRGKVIFESIFQWNQ
jgi:hypothetical protein